MLATCLQAAWWRAWAGPCTLGTCACVHPPPVTCRLLNGSRLVAAAFDPARQARAYAVNDRAQLLTLMIPHEHRTTTCKVRARGLVAPQPWPPLMGVLLSMCCLEAQLSVCLLWGRDCLRVPWRRSSVRLPWERSCLCASGKRSCLLVSYRGSGCL